MAPIIRPLTKPDVEPAFLLATEVFQRQSTLHRALGIGLEEYRAYLRPSFHSMTDEALSLVAVDNGKTVGCLIATDFHGADQNGETPPPFDAFSAMADSLGSLYRNHRRFGPGEVVLVDMAVVAPTASGQGLYRTFRAKAEALAQKRGFQYVVGELSSAATQHVVIDKLGHRKIAEIDFQTFRHRDKYPFRAITSPPSLILAEGNLRA